MRSKNKGFTLIEMLIVIAIIGILAGIVLTGVRGFQATARDTRRIGDVRNIQPLEELYFTRNGNYVDKSTLESSNLGTVPTAPAPTGDYDIYVAGDGLSYCISAELENPNSAAEADAQTGPCDTANTKYDCTSNQVFCVGSN